MAKQSIAQVRGIHLDTRYKRKAKEPLLHLRQIINRNIERHYSLDDIRKAFSGENYHEKNEDQKLILDRFFAEADESDLTELLVTSRLDKQNIVNLYRTSSHSKNPLETRWDTILDVTIERQPKKFAVKKTKAAELIAKRRSVA
jgi:DNA-binding transcriptional MerR regulator